MSRLLIALALLVTCPAIVSAEVIGFDIATRRPYAEGRALGDRGTFEQIRGKVHFAVDPKAPANRAIVDLDLAPLNAQRQVEFSADVEVIVPTDLSKANGGLFYEINNRGRYTALNMFNGGADEFLVRQGFIVLWSGWIAEVQPEDYKPRLDAPLARENGQLLRGVVRSELVVEQATDKASLSHRGMQGSYRPTERGLAEAKLFRRVREQDDRELVSRDKWRFVITDVPGGQLPVIELAVDGGLQAGVIYEVVYEAEGSVVQGTGLAGIRDLISFLKYDGSDRNPIAKGGKSTISRAIGFGTSQSGRAVRQLLYEDFNVDERGRKVFDGLISHVAGGGLGSFNHRFASPTRTNGQHEEHLFPADYFPFTYGEERDPFTGKTDSILQRPRASNSVPKVMHTQSSSEYWHRSGSLVHTDPLATRDSELPPEVRVYCFGGTQHGPGNGLPAPQAGGQLPSNPGDYRPLLRGLLMAMDSWIVDGREPPASAYPKISDQTLVSWKEMESGWQAIPGVNYPTVIQQPPMLDRGPEWDTLRRISIEPPQIKGHYVVRVPGYGPDNNERGTLAAPAIAVPVATYTSWNLRSKKIGGEGDLLGLQGGYIPLAKNQTERTKSGDPRPSLAERYGNYASYEKAFLAEVDRLAAARYLVEEDRPRLRAFCELMKPLFE